VGGKITNDGCEHANDEDGDDEAGPAVAVLSGGHAGKQHLPEDGQEVHHVVKAGWQPLFTGFVLIFIPRCKQCGRRGPALMKGQVNITEVLCSPWCLAPPPQGSKDAALLGQGGVVPATTVGSGHTRSLSDG